jgi:hypothetical protein
MPILFTYFLTPVAAAMPPRRARGSPQVPSGDSMSPAAMLAAMQAMQQELATSRAPALPLVPARLRRAPSPCGSPTTAPGAAIPACPPWLGAPLLAPARPLPLRGAARPHRPWRARAVPYSGRGVAQPRRPWRLAPAHPSAFPRPHPHGRRGGAVPCARARPRRARPLGAAQRPRPRLRRSAPSPRHARRGALRSPARRAAPAARPPRRSLLVPCRPRRGLELGPACLWRAALSSASARPRAFGLGVAPLSLTARSATRAQLGPDVCAARSRHVSAALRARVLEWCSWCFGTTRRALGALVYPPPPCICIPYVAITLSILMKIETQSRN